MGLGSFGGFRKEWLAESVPHRGYYNLANLLEFQVNKNGSSYTVSVFKDKEEIDNIYLGFQTEPKNHVEAWTHFTQLGKFNDLMNRIADEMVSKMQTNKEYSSIRHWMNEINTFNDKLPDNRYVSNAFRRHAYLPVVPPELKVWDQHKSTLCYAVDLDDSLSSISVKMVPQSDTRYYDAELYISNVLVSQVQLSSSREGLINSKVALERKFFDQDIVPFSRGLWFADTPDLIFRPDGSVPVSERSAADDNIREIIQDIMGRKHMEASMG